MHAQEIVLIMVIVLMELVIVRSDLQEKHAQRRHAHLIAIIKDIVLEDHVSVTHNTLAVIVHLHNAQIHAQVLDLVLTLLAFAMLDGRVKIVL